jgi:hypothetical protein
MSRRISEVAVETSETFCSRWVGGVDGGGISVYGLWFMNELEDDGGSSREVTWGCLLSPHFLGETLGNNVEY